MEIHSSGFLFKVTEAAVADYLSDLLPTIRANLSGIKGFILGIHIKLHGVNICQI